MPRKTKSDRTELIARCLLAFIEAGTLDMSLDQLASRVGISKRMLVHYFGGREVIEEKALTQLEESLRAQFAPELFPANSSPTAVVLSLWDQTTAPEARGVVVVAMEALRRAWNGSKRAKLFYRVQYRLWVKVLLKFLPDPSAVEELLHLFQGAVLVYLVTGDRQPGRRMLMRMLAKQRTQISSKKLRAAVRA